MNITGWDNAVAFTGFYQQRLRKYIAFNNFPAPKMIYTKKNQLATQWLKSDIVQWLKDNEAFLLSETTRKTKVKND